MTELNYIRIETAPNPDAAVIWLHGLGASGHDFEPIVPELGLPEGAAIRFIFPHAPELPVTVNGGMRMPAWYDIKAMDIDRVIDHEQLKISADAVARLIQQQVESGIDSRRIVVAGFSQGGAVAYESGLTFEQPLAAILGLSTYFATAKTVKPSPANASVTVSIYHGTMDPVVPESLGQLSVQGMKDIGITASYKTYRMEHSVCLEQIVDIGQFLQAALKL